MERQKNLDIKYQKNSNVITDINIPQYKTIKNIAKKKHQKIFTIGSKKSYLELTKHKYIDDKQLFEIKYKNKVYDITVNLIGKIQIKNVLMAMIAAEKSNITSATVLASTCAKADAYATSFMALGFEKSLELINELDDIEVYLTYNDQDNIQQFFVTEGMKKIILD